MTRSFVDESVELAAFVGGSGVDGGMNGPGEPASTWQQAEHLGLVEPTGVGVDFFDAPDALVSAAYRAGLAQVFLRMDWARLEPREGSIDRAVLGRYAEILSMFIDAGVRPQAVICDGALPAWLGVEGWLLPATPERFGRLAAAVSEECGDLLSGVVTLEAPAEWAFAGWVLGAAPPFRTAAVLDACAALDGMLSAHLYACEALKGSTLTLERGLLGSGGLLGELEALLLGLDPEGMPEKVAEWIVSRTPARARDLAAHSDEPLGSVAWVSVGSGPRPAEGIKGSIFGLLDHGEGTLELGDTVSRLRLGAARGQGRPVNIAYRHVAATIDSYGHREMGHAKSRAADLAVALEAIRVVRSEGLAVARLVAGELVDRWRFGTFEKREGLLGVDRLRGDKGFRLLATDAGGVDAAGVVRQLAAAPSPSS